MFNMSSVEYNPAFSKPGALEGLDKDYNQFSRKPTEVSQLDFG